MAAENRTLKSLLSIITIVDRKFEREVRNSTSRKGNTKFANDITISLIELNLYINKQNLYASDTCLSKYFHHKINKKYWC